MCSKIQNIVTLVCTEVTILDFRWVLGNIWHCMPRWGRGRANNARGWAEWLSSRFLQLLVKLQEQWVQSRIFRPRNATGENQHNDVLSCRHYTRNRATANLLTSQRARSPQHLLDPASQVAVFLGMLLTINHHHHHRVYRARIIFWAWAQAEFETWSMFKLANPTSFRAQAVLSSEIQPAFEPKPSQALILGWLPSRAEPANLRLFCSSWLEL